ncbi:hypothetical protein [Hyphococcus lacteus]|uniref:Lipoprotein n=1 Tax=Hyphococcus lacteus TaxID=3143536 RepID=A0ABV3Z7H2_9PROT
MQTRFFVVVLTALTLLGCATAQDRADAEGPAKIDAMSDGLSSVLPRIHAERNPETGDLTVEVFLGRCTSSSLSPAGDTLNVTLDRDGRKIHISGYFLFEKAIGGVKKDCRRTPTRQFVFENVEPTIYVFSYDTGYNRLFIKSGRSVDFTLQNTDLEPLTCENAENASDKIDLNGVWHPEDNRDRQIILRSGEPTFLSWKECVGPMLCGGVVPEFLTTETPNVFDFPGLGRTEFLTSSCAVITQPNSNYQTRLIKNASF